MAIHLPPHPGDILLCDYELGRAVRLSQEMTKRRPVVVLSPQRRRTVGPVIVVPLSTSPSAEANELHGRLAAGRYHFLRSDADSWAKCEFVCSVSARRLDVLRHKGARGTPRLADADLRLIVRASMRALGAAELHFQA